MRCTLPLPCPGQRGELQEVDARWQVPTYSEGQDIMGQALQENQPCLDENYNNHFEAGKSYPRAEIARDIPLRTAMAVPLPGSDGGPSGVLVLYSPNSFAMDPSNIGFVQKAVNVLLTNVWDHKILDMMDVESIEHS